jgi:hypothetical protein
MANDYWFFPKTHGYGAYPKNWKGWAAIGVFILAELVLVLALIALVLPSRAGEPLNLALIVAWLAVMAALIVGFYRLTRARTDGEWRWRWGEDRSQ